jgi:hypothetical protein
VYGVFVVDGGKFIAKKHSMKKAAEGKKAASALLAGTIWDCR